MFRQQRRAAHFLQAQQPVRKSGLDKFSTSLNTFQQVLEVVHSTAPYIEKYGPMVQKLPTMYRMYRAIKSIDEPTTNGNHLEEQTNTSTTENNTYHSPSTPANEYPNPTLYI